MDGCSIYLGEALADNTDMDAQRVINELERIHTSLRKTESKAEGAVEMGEGYPYALGVSQGGSQMVQWDIEALIDTIKESQ